MIELPEFFTAQQAQEFCNELSNSKELNNVAVDGLRTVMNEWIKPALLGGGGNVWIGLDRSHTPYYHVRWKIKRALEMNGFSVSEIWDNGVMWKVSWSND